MIVEDKSGHHKLIAEKTKFAGGWLPWAPSLTAKGLVGTIILSELEQFK